MVVNRKELGDFKDIRAEIVYHDIWGVPGNILVLHLPLISAALSGRQGYRRVKLICNCYIPVEIWPLLESKGCQWTTYTNILKRMIIQDTDVRPEAVAILLTGVNMEQLDWAKEEKNSLWVQAWVTAGVSTNAMRVGVDKSVHTEGNESKRSAGTINVIILTSAKLSMAAMAASFITVTEAKMMALEELDIRSAYSPELRATGTGTDQVVVVSGQGERFIYVGGHSKLGEMMAKAVTRATKGAIVKRLKALKDGKNISV